MMGPRSGAALLACVAALLDLGPPAAHPRPGARIWLGRHQEIEEYLRTSECVSMEMIVPSLGRCTLRPGGPVARMAWRPLRPGVHRGFRESYKAEIAAYELDKLLKLDMVPPSVERQLEGSLGAAQLWVEDASPLARDASPPGSERVRWEAQVGRMRVFDNLIGNPDRNQGNILCDAEWNLILLDHSRAFGEGTDLPYKLGRIDGGLWAGIEALTSGTLEAALGALLEQGEIHAILERRDRMRAEIGALPK
jgi:hypothetical protein